MPIQVYECPKDGEWEHWQSIKEEIEKKRPCPTCSSKSPHKLVPCGGIRIMRGWNEQANDYQRTPYTMAQAQVHNNYHEKRDMGIDLPKPSEADIQIAARNIAAGGMEAPKPVEGVLRKNMKDYKRRKKANGG